MTERSVVLGSAPPLLESAVSPAPKLPAKQSGTAPIPGRRISAPEFTEENDAPTSIDRLLHASAARFTMRLSPSALWLADSAIHLLSSPGRLEQLAEKAVRKAIRLFGYAAEFARNPDCRPCIEPFLQDQRFRSDPETWYATTGIEEGSWWPAYHVWSGRP